MAKKKVVIVIVEGVSDERALSSINKYMKEVFDIHIHFTRGDIFTKNKHNTKAIKAVVGDEIQKVMNETKYSKKDILAVVQITDTDGTFIDESSVTVDETLDVNKIYLNNCIKVANQNRAVGIKQRNKEKSSRLKTMYSVDQVKGIPYYLLYFSCNLDHIIHNERNLDEGEKTSKAREFSKKYRHKLDDFLKYFKESSFVVNGSHRETWEFIQIANNSLGRFSNFHLIFDILDTLLTEKDSQAEKLEPKNN